MALEAFKAQFDALLRSLRKVLAYLAELEEAERQRNLEDMRAEESRHREARLLGSM